MSVGGKVGVTGGSPCVDMGVSDADTTGGVRRPGFSFSISLRGAERAMQSAKKILSI